MRPLVWLPFDPAALGEVPDGLRYETVLPSSDGSVPGSVGEVEFYVTPYRFGMPDLEFVGHASRLRVVQTLTAGDRKSVV